MSHTEGLKQTAHADAVLLGRMRPDVYQSIIEGWLGGIPSHEILCYARDEFGYGTYEYEQVVILLSRLPQRPAACKGCG